MIEAVETDISEMEDCTCKTAYFHAKFPSLVSQTRSSSPGQRWYPFNDVVYAKTNSSIFSITERGELLIKKPGTYMLNLDARISGVDGDWDDSAAFEAFAVVETPEEYSPAQSELMPLMMESIGKEIIDHRRARFHSANVIHIGDSIFGIDSYGARITFKLETEGNFAYLAEMQLTITRL